MMNTNPVPCSSHADQPVLISNQRPRRVVVLSERFLEHVVWKPVGVVVFGDVHTNDAFNLVVEQLHQQFGGLVI